MTTPSIGHLRVRFQLQSASLSSGSASTQWTTRATLWGAVEAVGFDAALSSTGTTRVTHIITLRRPASLTLATGMRLVRDGRALTIRSVRDADPRRRFVEVRAEEGGTLA